MNLGAGLQPAFVLHSRRFRETSLILEILSESQGRLGMLAKGAYRRKESSGLLQPFVPLLVAWSGRGELPVLTHSEPAGKALALQGRALYCGLYINELILRLTQVADPHCQLFPAYISCLQRLQDCSDSRNEQLEPILRRFELDLLDELGLGLQLREDHQGEKIEPQRQYYYDLECGPRAPQGQEPGLTGGTLLNLADDQLTQPEQRREARELMRRILAHHLGGRELRSRELFR